MTREEQIIKYVEEKYKSLMNGKGNTPEGNGYLVAMGDILRFCETLNKEDSQELDDAAYNWVMDNFGSPKESLFQFDCKSFKAGAKWMSEQGEIHETKVVKDDDDYDDFAGPWGTNIIKCETNFNRGDKVIVQIRKV